MTVAQMSGHAAYTEMTSEPGDLTVSWPTLAAMLRESFPPSTAMPSDAITSHMAAQASYKVAPSPGSLAGHIQLPLHLTSWYAKEKNACRSHLYIQLNIVADSSKIRTELY